MVFNKANILLPNVKDLSKWSVVACDQFTSEPKYWNAVGDYIGTSPSALNIIFPELYLNDNNGDERIKSINTTMEKYLHDGIFTEYPSSLILVERKQSDGKVRHGIIGMVDLEEYNFSKGSSSKIRATEGTIAERIPPRVKIRKDAPIELPHIILLIDDKKEQIINSLITQKASFDKLYDFELMLGSGHLRAWRLSDPVADEIISKIDALGCETAFRQKYNLDGGVLQIAVGDGNHSLATAKTVWESVKATLAPNEQLKAPARFALVELMSIYDEALEFKPIHRVVFGADKDDLLSKLDEYATGLTGSEAPQTMKIVTKQGTTDFTVNHPVQNLTVGTLQAFLDEYIARGGATLDYVHGDDSVAELVDEKNAIGFILPAMEKEELFTTVIKDGALPRKTFSMGEAKDKRFYTEAKKIK